MDTLTKEQKFGAAIASMADRLYDETVWTKRKENYEAVGIDCKLYQMQCEVFEKLYNEQPDYFTGYQWINSDDGMPLWVRPGVEWLTQDELEDEYD